MNPYRKPPLSKQATKALVEVTTTHTRYLKRQAAADEAAVDRARAVKRALDAGVSTRDLANRLGVSAETVRRMGQEERGVPGVDHRRAR